MYNDYKIIEKNIFFEELKCRQDKAIEQLNSLINEQIHRKHGCFYNEIDIEDLQLIIDILKGKV